MFSAGNHSVFTVLVGIFRLALARTMKRTFLFLIAWGLLLVPQTVEAQISFTDVSSSSGFYGITRTWGIAWGDLNGDGYPDAFVSNHFRGELDGTEEPWYFINQGDGTFNISLAANDANDIHAGAWADLDNDGDDELIVTSGRVDRNQLFFNRWPTNPVDVTAPSKLGHEHSRGRTPLWVDVNQDGKLDIIITYIEGLVPEAEQAGVYIQEALGFVDRSLEYGFLFAEDSHGGSLMDIDGDGVAELAIDDDARNMRIYEIDQQPFALREVINQPLITDMVWGDFDNDLRSDLYMVSNQRRASYKTWNRDSIQAFLWPQPDAEQGFSFYTENKITVRFHWGLPVNPPILVGGAETELFGNEFELFPSDPQNWGYPSATVGVDTLLRLGYNPATKRWKIALLVPDIIKGMDLVVEGDGIKDIVLTNLDSIPGDILEDEFYWSTASGLQEASSSVGINGQWGSHSATTADFDNDGDLDIYMACAAGWPNLPNVLWENQGDGTFEQLNLAGGAQGSNKGLADVVTAVDYNKDGFIDLAVANGRSDFYQDNYNLFKNNGNSNHWFVPELKGSESNSEGIGAVVQIYTDGDPQMRVQSGGMHRYAQDHPRLHFGLGSEQIIDTLIIHWPGQRTQRFYEVAVDRYQVIPEAPEDCPPPENVSVSSGVFGARIFNWSSVPAADSYRLLVRKNSNMFDRYDETSTSRSLTGLGGNFDYTVQSICGADSSGHAILQSKGGGSRESVWTADLQAFPNPAVDQVVLHGFSEGILEYSVLDLQGKVLLEGRQEVYHELNLDLSGIEAGVYLFQSSQNIEPLRLIKQ